MSQKPSVFNKTYDYYLEQIGKIDLISVADRLDLESSGDQATVSVFNEKYQILKSGIFDTNGKQPPFDICIIIFKYFLLCPDDITSENDLVSFREFKDSGPLTVYFRNEVENSITNFFSGRLNKLKNACVALGGHSPDIELSYDLTMRFDALSKIPIFLLFDDKDDEFPAKASVLYERNAEKYLDAECLAILGRLLSTRLGEVL